MKASVRALGVSRSNLLEQRSKRQKATAAVSEPEPADGPETEETAENGLLLARIRQLVGERPSYGYRRVTALLNREGTERVNPNRIYRTMRRSKLLLERCTGDDRGRKHAGVIVTLKPDLRWCSAVSRFGAGAANASGPTGGQPHSYAVQLRGAATRCSYARATAGSPWYSRPETEVRRPTSAGGISGTPPRKRSPAKRAPDTRPTRQQRARSSSGTVLRGRNARPDGPVERG